MRRFSQFNSTRFHGSPRGDFRDSSRGDFHKTNIPPVISGVYINTEEEMMIINGHMFRIPHEFYCLVIEKITGNSINDKRDGYSPLLLKSIPGIPLDPPPVTSPADAFSVEDPAVAGPAVEGPAVEGPAVEDPAVAGPVDEDPSVAGPAVEDPSVAGSADEDPAVAGPAFTSVRRRIPKCFSCREEGHTNLNCPNVCKNDDCTCDKWHMNGKTRDNGSGRSPNDISWFPCKAGNDCTYNRCKFNHRGCKFNHSV